MSARPTGSPVQLQALVVDYGGVLTSNLGGAMRQWCEGDGIDHAGFAAVMREWLTPGAPSNPVHDLETGRLSGPDFEFLLATRLCTRTGGPVAADGLLTRMFAGFSTEPEMYSLVHRARSAGLRTALLSNSWGNTYPKDQLEELFDVVVISAEVGLRKPAPEIYLLCAERLGLPTQACVFVDDLRPNVQGATDVGMVGVLHADSARTNAELELLFGWT